MSDHCSPVFGECGSLAGAAAMVLPSGNGGGGVVVRAATTEYKYENTCWPTWSGNWKSGIQQIQSQCDCFYRLAGDILTWDIFLSSQARGCQPRRLHRRRLWLN
jgi:hypothetical protein